MKYTCWVVRTGSTTRVFHDKHAALSYVSTADKPRSLYEQERELVTADGSMQTRVLSQTLISSEGER